MTTINTNTFLNSPVLACTPLSCTPDEAFMLVSHKILPSVRLPDGSVYLPGAAGVSGGGNGVYKINPSGEVEIPRLEGLYVQDWWGQQLMVTDCITGKQGTFGKDYKIIW